MGDFRAKIYQKFRWESVIRFFVDAMRQKLHLPSYVAAGSILLAQKCNNQSKCFLNKIYYFKYYWHLLFIS